LQALEIEPKLIEIIKPKEAEAAKQPTIAKPEKKKTISKQESTGLPNPVNAKSASALAMNLFM